MIIITSDSVRFDVSDDFVDNCSVLKDFAEDIDDDDPVPLPIVTSQIFQSIVRFYDGSTNGKNAVEATSPQKTLEIMNAADYLGAVDLIAFCAKKLARLFDRGFTRNELRDMLGIVGDFTADEELEIEKELAWTLDLNPSYV